ncbi:MAG TPA: NADAR family protein [Candidatus Competibacteraceae bacterium]|nr:NADAR family protein [Candidatus Competibacteraceae bacterium]
MADITSFRGEHAFLSNFQAVEIVYEGKPYPTVEHAFQAAKTLDPGERETVRLAKTPTLAKRLGRRVTLRRDWETVKVAVMRELLRLKFQQPALRERLLATGETRLIEGNKWNDRTWGCVWVKTQWVGRNLLGQLLMEVRTEVRALSDA